MFCNINDRIILYEHLFVHFKLELRGEREKVEKLEKSICEASEDAQKQVICLFYCSVRHGSLTSFSFTQDGPHF